MGARAPFWAVWAAGQWVWKTREFSAVAMARCCPKLSMSWRSWKSLSSSTSRACACTLQHTFHAVMLKAVSGLGLVCIPGSKEG